MRDQAVMATGGELAIIAVAALLLPFVMAEVDK
jgi:hypothetical protein